MYFFTKVLSFGVDRLRMSNRTRMYHAAVLMYGMYHLRCCGDVYFFLDNLTLSGTMRLLTLLHHETWSSKHIHVWPVMSVTSTRLEWRLDHSATEGPSGLKHWNQTLVPVVRARFEPRCGRPHFAPMRSGVRVCGRNSTEAREREWAEGTVSSLPGTLNVRIKFCHSTGIARSGGGVRASTTSYA